MPRQDIQHESLLLPGYWRITSFGKLAENPLNAGPDLRIRTYLAPLVAASDSMLRDGKLAVRLGRCCCRSANYRAFI